MQKISLIDYPGKVACVAFTVGCNFRCPFCYSKELVLPEEIRKVREIPEKDFFVFLKSRQGMLDGVAICGGEPTIHKDLLDFVQRIKKLNFEVKLDTNGSNPDVLQTLINERIIDYAAMDIKSPKRKYDFFSGAGCLKQAEKSVEILKRAGIDYEFRTTAGPGISRDDLIEISGWIAGKNVNYFLQEFYSEKPILNPEILELRFLKRKELLEISEELKPKFQNVVVR